MDGLNSEGYLQGVVLHRYSVENRNSFKSTLVVHALLLAAMLFRLSSSLLVLLGIRPPPFLQSIPLPRPCFWEQLWLLSAVPLGYGLAAVRRTRLAYLHRYLVLSVLFGVLPIVYGIFDLSDELVMFFETHQSKKMLFGLPVVLVWNVFLAVSIQVQAFAFYFAWQLMKTWKARIELKQHRQ